MEPLSATLVVSTVPAAHDARRWCAGPSDGVWHAGSEIQVRSEERGACRALPSQGPQSALARQQQLCTRSL